MIFIIIGPGFLMIKIGLGFMGSLVYSRKADDRNIDMIFIILT
jgi:hypothetical protein